MRAQHVGKQLRLPRVEADLCAPDWPLAGGMNNRVDHSRGRTASKAQLLGGVEEMGAVEVVGSAELCFLRRGFATSLLMPGKSGINSMEGTGTMRQAPYA
jgi:hypothetical protein